MFGVGLLSFFETSGCNHIRILMSRLCEGVVFFILLFVSIKTYRNE